MGFYRPDRGKVELFGKDPRREGPVVLARTGWVPDQLHADEGMRVRELLDFVASAYHRWDKAYCYRLLSRFDLPLEARIRDLSRGMRTQISLLLALSHRPELILLDDPTLGLDAIVMEEFVEALGEAHRIEGVTIVLASHEYEEIERIVTHVGLLRQGALLLASPLEELKRRTQEIRMSFPGRPPDISGMPGIANVQVVGHRLTAMATDVQPDVINRLRSLAPSEMSVCELSLRQMFVRLLRNG
jgi:ABC-2 type transport system ATP-binding protein